ncbi:GNAT family N-acetyltransferase [Streptomyces sp. NPDC059104]|uniref:GNAT family N-acetyltransferase n=1 Tax=Streptomyces sp. NPDC059104 TaxID=3346729 RepID=UPI0036795DED
MADFRTVEGLGTESEGLLSDARFGFYSSAPWWRAARGPDVDAPGYLTAVADGEVCGLAPLSFPQHEDNTGYTPHLLFPYRPQAQYALIGPRRGYRAHLPVRHRVAADVVGGFFETAADAAASRGTDWVYALHLTTDSADALADSGVARPILSPLMDTWVRAHGTSMDDYYASCRGGRAIRRERRRAAAVDVEVAHERLADCVDEVALLTRQSLERHGSTRSLASLTEELRLASEHAAEQEVLTTVRRAGRLLGYSLDYVWGDVLWGRSCAMVDELRTNESPLAFELTFYMPLELCYERGLRGIHLGPTNLAAKVRRGAELVPLWQASLYRGEDVFPVEGIRPWTAHVLDTVRTQCAPHTVDDRLAEIEERALAYGRGTRGALPPLPDSGIR